MTDERDDFVSDTEIARRWHINEKAARIAIRVFEANPRFPKKDPLFGGKRYWRAVKAFMEWRAGLTVVAPEPMDGGERLGQASENRRRSRPSLASAR